MTDDRDCGAHAVRIENLEEGDRDHELRLRELELWRARLESRLAAYAGIGSVLGAIIWKLVEHFAKI